MLTIPDEDRIKAILKEDFNGFRHAFWPAVGGIIGAAAGAWAWHLVSKFLG